MKVTIQYAPEEVEINDEQIARLGEIAKQTSYYWTQGRSGELLDELASLGLVYENSSEQYQLTRKGKLVYEKVCGR